MKKDMKVAMGKGKTGKSMGTGKKISGFGASIGKNSKGKSGMEGPCK